MPGQKHTILHSVILHLSLTYCEQKALVASPHFIPLVQHKLGIAGNYIITYAILLINIRKELQVNFSSSKSHEKILKLLLQSANFE